MKYKDTNLLETFSLVQNSSLVKHATEQLSCLGTLCQKDGHYIFLKISDDFIYKLFPFIPDPSKQIPDYFSSSPPIGAHISVVYPQELHHQPNLGRSIGKEFSFKIKEPFHALLRNKIYWGCTVEAPELIALRKKLGLKPALNFHGTQVPLHFTIVRYSLKS